MGPSPTPTPGVSSLGTTEAALPTAPRWRTYGKADDAVRGIEQALRVSGLHGTHARDHVDVGTGLAHVVHFPHAAGGYPDAGEIDPPQSLGLRRHPRRPVLRRDLLELRKPLRST